MNQVDLLGHRKQNPSNRGPCNALRTIADPAIEETQQTRSNHTMSTGGCGPVAQTICQTNTTERCVCQSRMANAKQERKIMRKTYDR